MPILNGTSKWNIWRIFSLKKITGKSHETNLIWRIIHVFPLQWNTRLVQCDGNCTSARRLLNRFGTKVLRWMQWKGTQFTVRRERRSRRGAEIADRSHSHSSSTLHSFGRLLSIESESANECRRICCKQFCGGPFIDGITDLNPFDDFLVGYSGFEGMQANVWLNVSRLCVRID